MSVERWRAIIEQAKAEAYGSDPIEQEIEAVRQQSPARLPCGLRELAPDERTLTGAGEQGRTE
jgi:hypothetical protein